jgi:hypothetical protein
MDTAYLDDEATVLMEIISIYENVCAELKIKNDETNVSQLYVLYDCISFILARMKHEMSPIKFNDIVQKSKSSYTKRFSSALEHIFVELKRTEPLQPIFFDMNRGIDTNSLEVAMTKRGYIECKQKTVVRKLRWYIAEELRIFREPKSSVETVVLPSTDGHSV